MRAPASQFYWKDWTSDLALRRCSFAARGAWMDILALLHHSDEYGVVRWPLAELASTAGVPLKLAKELVSKNVLKGADFFSENFTYAPRSGGKAGEPVVLVEGNGGPCWFSSRFVRDKWVASRRGGASRFTSETQPSRQPNGRMGEPVGYGPAFASASASAFASEVDTSASANRSLGAAPALARALRSNGYPECSDNHPDLVALQREGVTPEELVAAIKPGKPIAFIVQRVRGKRADAIERSGQPGSHPTAVSPERIAEQQREREFDDAVRKAYSDRKLGLLKDDAALASRLTELGAPIPQALQVRAAS